MDRNQKVFPTYAHRAIWSEGLMLVPPEESLKGFKGAEKEAHRDLYNYFSHAYEDMYKNPESWGIDCEGIEKEIGPRKPRQARIAAEWNNSPENVKNRDKKLKKLDELKRIDFLRIFFGRLAESIQFDGECYFEEEEMFKKYLYAQKRRYGFTAKDTVLEDVLKRSGFSVKYKDGKAIFENERYPGMFRAVYDWHKFIDEKAEKEKSSAAAKRKWKAAFWQLDCRVFDPDYRQTLENSLWFMSDELREFMQEVETLLNSFGLKLIKSDSLTSFSLECKCKGVTLARLTVKDSFPVFRTKMFRASLPNTAAEQSLQYAEFERRVEELPNAEEFKKECFRRMERCQKCGCCGRYYKVPPSRWGRISRVFGKEVRLCDGCWSFKTEEFTPQILETVKTIIKINYDISKMK